MLVLVATHIDRAQNNGRFAVDDQPNIRFDREFGVEFERLDLRFTAHWGNWPIINDRLIGKTLLVF